MKKKEQILSDLQKRTAKVVLMQMLGEELEKILQNKLVVKNFSKIEKFSEKYIREVEKNILVNTANAQIRKELSTRKEK